MNDSCTVFIALEHFKFVCIIFLINEFYNFLCFLFTDSLIFISVWRTTFLISCRTSLVEMYFLSFSLYGNSFMSFLFLKDRFLDHCISCWHFFPLSFVKISCQFYVHKVSTEKSGEIGQFLCFFFFCCLRHLYLITLGNWIQNVM